MSVAYTTQNVRCFSVPKEEFLRKVVYNEDLSKKDLRVIMLLLTSLSGFEDGQNRKDPNIFTDISVKQMAEELYLEKDDVKACINHLIKEGILEHGKSKATKGYRFRF